MTGIIRSALEQYALNNARAWEGDRQQTIGASEIGKCARQVFWAKHEGDRTYGVARDPEYVDTWGAKVRGTYFEDYFWAPAMQAAFGDWLLYSGPAQVTLVSGFLSATPDGLVAPEPDDCFTIECKTIDPRVVLTEPKFEHVYQAQVQMGMFHAQSQFKPTHAIISYTDASFWDNVTEFRVDYDPEVFAVALDRARTIMMAKSGAELKPEGWIAGGKECEVCPFTRACGIERAKLPNARREYYIDTDIENEITELALSIERFKQVKEGNEVAIRNMQEALKEHLRNVQRRYLNNDRVRISWSPVKARETYDNKAIQQLAVAAGVDIEKYKKIGEPSDRLQITPLA